MRWSLRAVGHLNKGIMGERLERIKRPCWSLEYKMAPCLRGMYDLWELAQLSAVLGGLSSLSAVLRHSFFHAVFPLYRRAGLKHGVKTVFMAGQPLRQRPRLLHWCSRVRDRHQKVILICNMEVSFTLYSSVFISWGCCLSHRNVGISLLLEDRVREESKYSDLSVQYCRSCYTDQIYLT